MAIDKDMLDQLLAGRDPQDLFVKDGLLDEPKKALSELCYQQSWAIIWRAKAPQAQSSGATAHPEKPC